jgi:hypothetical protein
MVDQEERAEMTVENTEDPCLESRNFAGAGGRRIDCIYIHYTYSGDLGDAAQTRATIDAWHKKRGFIMVGYHRMFTPRGEEAIGRPDYMMGAHVSGHNAYSLGICAVGADSYDWYPTPEQYAGIAARCRAYMAQYPLVTIGRIWPHRRDQSTSCPGRFDMEKLIGMVRSEKPREVEAVRWSTRNTTWDRVTFCESHAFLGRNEGQRTDEDCWLAITPFDGDAKVRVEVITNSAVKGYTYNVKQNKLQEVALSGFGLTGPVTYRVSSNVPVVVTADLRGWG